MKNRKPIFNYAVSYKTAKIERILFRALNVTYEFMDGNRRWEVWISNTIELGGKEFYSEIYLHPRKPGFKLDWYFFNEQTEEIQNVNFEEIFQAADPEAKKKLIYYLDIL